MTLTPALSQRERETTQHASAREPTLLPLPSRERIEVRVNGATGLETRN
jgi:hypothetical protein